jgi:arsenate reductase (thioredoxin)
MTTAMAFTLMLTAAAQSGAAGSTASIVFVCEHGAAKSLIAAAYFNKLAAERGLAARALFRGVTPDDALSAAAVAGLRADGLEVPLERPTALGPRDVERATHIFAIGCALPGGASASGKAARWDDVPDGKGYAPMRDAIVVRVRALLDSLPSVNQAPAPRRQRGTPWSARPDVQRIAFRSETCSPRIAAR